MSPNHECVLRTFVAPKVRGEDLVAKIFTQLEASSSCFLSLNIITNPF